VGAMTGVGWCVAAEGSGEIGTGAVDGCRAAAGAAACLALTTTTLPRRAPTELRGGLFVSRTVSE
jgi:hypothetical protein